MEVRCSDAGLKFLFSWILVLSIEIQSLCSLNDEGQALLNFKARVNSDPCAVFANWNPRDTNPCSWSGVYCFSGKVQILNLKGLYLEGTLAPDIGRLPDLRFLILRQNYFSGAVPEEIKQLRKLELLDLRDNNFHGTVEVRRSVSPKYLIKLQNKFPHGFEYSSCHKHRRKLLSDSSNVIITLNSTGNSLRQIISGPTVLKSGALPAVSIAKKNQSHHEVAPLMPSSAARSQANNQNKSDGRSASQPSLTSAHSRLTLLYSLIVLVGLLLFVSVSSVLLMWRKRGAAAIVPWKAGLSAQLQKAFVSGVPKLNRSELETACEDFSNIIDSYKGCTFYKGTLSSGVEIAVASTSVVSLKDWSRNAEISYQKKIDVLSRINHKNFVNLIGYCEEDEPFIRMMVFEYAPNGTLFEHLHVKEMEHLDWNARMRIIMGIAYCLQHMHHDLNPHISHSDLSSHSVCLTDDYAAKIAEICFLPHPLSKMKLLASDATEHQELPPAAAADRETNVYGFGILMLEIISGRLPEIVERELIEKWAEEFASNKAGLKCLIDPTLKSFKHVELEVIFEVIGECIQVDPRRRPTMKAITSRLREVIPLSPEQATPRLSPLWWAELEILSLEAT